MFLVFSILFIFIGILLLIKSKKMEKAYGANIVVGLSAIVMAILGQVMMEAPMAATFAGAPAGVMADFKLMIGMEYSFNGTIATPLTSILILLATTVVFYALSVWNLSRKKK